MSQEQLLLTIWLFREYYLKYSRGQSTMSYGQCLLSDYYLRDPGIWGCLDTNSAEACGA